MSNVVAVFHTWYEKNYIMANWIIVNKVDRKKEKKKKIVPTNKQLNIFKTIKI